MLLFSLYFGLLPFDNLKDISNDTITKTIGMILICILVIKFLLKRDKKVTINFFITNIIIIFLLYSFSYFIFTDANNKNYLRFCFLFLLFILSSQYNIKKLNLEKVYKYSTIILTGISILSIILNLSMKTIDRTHYYIWINMSMDANIYCASMIFPIIYLSNKIFSNDTKYKVISICMLLPIIFSIFLSGSRGGIVSIIIGLLIIFIFNFNKNKMMHKIFYAIIGILMACLLLRYLPNNISKRLSIDMVIKDKATDRFVIWDYAIKKYKSSNIIKKFLGYGFLSFSKVTGLKAVSHNLIIQTLIEGGLLMIIVFSNLFYQTIKFFMKNRNYMVLAYIITVLAMTCSLDSIVSRFFWNALMIINFSIINKEEK